MIKYGVCAVLAALFAVPALAQAVPIDVELEGEIESYDNATRTLVVMGMKVEIPATATLHSPVTSQAESGLNVNQWFKSAVLPGRTRAGFLGGTAIVIGQWDAGRQVIVASDVASEPAENVALAVVTASWCTTANCDGATDYIRGATKVGGAPGPAMLPLRDRRMAAAPVGDESGFALNLAGANLNGIGYAAEGYYGDIAVAVPTGTTGSTVAERAFHYFNFDLAGYFPELLLNKNIREVNAFRAQCRVGKDFEVRGHVHTRVSNAGAISDTIQPTSGVVQVQYPVNGVLQRFSASATAVDVGSPTGIYRIRFTPPGNSCPEKIDVRWLPAANSLNGAAYASTTGYDVEIRAD
jgi:hypothetical protein